MICEFCKKENDGSYGTGRFCNHTCQAKYAWKLACKKAHENKSKKYNEIYESKMNAECICERCNKTYIRKNGISNRFCSRACANTRNHSEKTKQKIANTLKRLPDKFCLDCGCILNRRNSTGYCKICCRKHNKISDTQKEKLRKIQLEKVQNGTHQGWKTRNIKSYAEKFFENVLSNENINFEREKSVGKFFLDFVIDGWLDLEIDGKQHKYKERKESDELRDEFLRTNGYFVYRIAWNEINSNEGKQMMKEKIDLFLEFYTKFVIFGNDQKESLCCLMRSWDAYPQHLHHRVSSFVVRTN